MGRFSKYATPEILPKKERLTVTQLAGYDDILTDALVDHVRESLPFVSGLGCVSTNDLLRCTSGLRYGRIDQNTI